MELTRTNKYVYKKYKKANDLQKAKMRETLKEQLDNLEMLYNKMLEHDNIKPI